MLLRLEFHLARRRSVMGRAECGPCIMSHECRLLLKKSLESRSLAW